jgi:hypothetical protein
MLRVKGFDDNEGGRMLRRIVACTLVALMAGVTWVPVTHAQQTVTQSVSIPAKLQGSLTAWDCTNSPGPWITFQGEIALGGLNVELVFRNNINRDVHTLVEDGQVVSAVTIGEKIVIPKQPSHVFLDGSGTGVGGNPWISIQLVDRNGSPLTQEILLGRCVQGAFTPAADFFAGAFAQALVNVMDCTNNPGPFINVSGSVGFSGVKARFIFRNQRDDGAPHEAIATVDLTAIQEGFTLRFPKQPVHGGVGGNPWISVRFADGSGQALGEEVLLGRCVQLVPGNR